MGPKRGATTITSHPEIYFTIEGGKDIGYLFEKLEWQAMVNGIILMQATFRDSYWSILDDLFVHKKYFEHGRKMPTTIEWEVFWPGGEGTGRHKGYLTDVRAKGIPTGGGFTLTVIDPPNYWLNAGASSGKCYKGSVREVIEQVIEEYYISPNEEGQKKVSKTLDNVGGKWYMMRMDPKTFIFSLLDWASGIVKSKTNFMVSSDGSMDQPESSIHILDQSEKESKDFGEWIYNDPGTLNARDFELNCDTFLSTYHRQFITAGISATTELYMDRITDKERQVIHVTDQNTSNKKNVKITSDQGFAKPEPSIAVEIPHEWSTFIKAIPEHSGGEMGLPYHKYIDGRARNKYLQTLPLGMRMKLRVIGESYKDLSIAHNLGVSKVKIKWSDQDGVSFHLGGPWLIHGFHHSVSRGGWWTDLFLHRIDYDAEADKI